MTIAPRDLVRKLFDAAIAEMNCVRKHLSAIKGGRLAAACSPAQVLTLLISDVPGDDPSIIASGPTVADPTTCAEAREILEKYAICEPPRVHEYLRGACEERPKPGDPRLARSQSVLIATPQMSLEAAAALARDCGVTPVILGDSIEGEARDVAMVQAGIARQIAVNGHPVKRPFVTSGIRIGSPAMTTRDFKDAEAAESANLIADVLDAPNDHPVIERVAEHVRLLTSKYPVYGPRPAP